jgi:uncharacterized protein YndB with AHSA1/START domain
MPDTTPTDTTPGEKTSAEKMSAEKMSAEKTSADRAEFSWAWDGEDEPPSTVTVRVEPADDGRSTVLMVEHGPHVSDEAGQTAHALHWEGWEYFLPRLPVAVSASREAPAGT